MKKLLFLAAFGLAAAAAAHAQMQITGAGATFPQIIYTKWFSEYAKVDTSVQFNYQGIGPGGGRTQILAETVDFGASDAPMSDAELAKAPRPILNLPTVAGAVVVTYNVPGDPKLKFDGPTLANIFLGKINKWSDPAIAALNPGVTLPDQEIVIVHRADSSGTTFCFTDYLSSVSSDWKSGPGKGGSVSWPVGFGAKGNPGVAGQIKQSPGAIGYVEIAYARQNKLPYADMENSSGNFITPTLESVTASLASAKIPDDFRFSMVNPPGATAYPISTTTWLLIYVQQKDSAKGQKLVQFLRWAYADGQKMAGDLDYAPLPDALIQRILIQVNAIKY